MDQAIPREQRIEQALFHGANLTLKNPDYAREVRTITDALLGVDLNPQDQTVAALEIKSKKVCASVLAREPGVAAGFEEFAFLLENRGIAVGFEKKNGETFQAGEMVLRLEGDQNELLSLERVGLNLLQRMSGIATLTRCLQERVRGRSISTRIVATRKTLWGLLDKRAVHLGGGGTHRIGLGDAILIKNNHLALIAQREEEAAPLGSGARVELSQGGGVHRGGSAQRRRCAARGGNISRSAERIRRELSVLADARQPGAA